MEYLEYKGKKYPFIITMSTLIEFKQASGLDFEIAFSQGLEKMYESMLMMTILGLRKGFELETPPFYKIIWNYITTGSKIGIKAKDYVKIIDTEYLQISSFIPSFFSSLSEDDKKK